jgi:hypothetical protein
MPMIPSPTTSSLCGHLVRWPCSRPQLHITCIWELLLCSECVCVCVCHTPHNACLSRSHIHTECISVRCAQVKLVHPVPPPMRCVCERAPFETRACGNLAVRIAAEHTPPGTASSAWPCAHVTCCGGYVYGSSELLELLNCHAHLVN